MTRMDPLQVVRSWSAAAAGSGLRSRLISAAFASMALKGLSAVLMTLISFVLARLLGPAGYGAYSFALAVATLLTIPGSLGLPTLLIRSVPAYRVREAHGEIRGLMLGSLGTTLGASILVSLTTVATCWLFVERLGQPRFETLSLGMLLLPMLVLLNVQQAGLQGLGHVAVSQIPTLALRQVVFLAMLVVALLTRPGAITPQWALMLHGLAIVLSLTVGARLLWSRVPVAVRRAAPVFHAAEWARRARALWMLAGVTIVVYNTDLVMLGILSDDRSTGIYRIATLVVSVIGFGLYATDTALGPNVAELHARRENERLQRVLVKAARFTFFYAAPLSLLIVLLGRPLLSIFSPEFVEGYGALVILSLGTMLGAALGSAELLLKMTGHERDALRGLALGALVNIVLNAVLIPRWGAQGAALATAVCHIVWKGYLAHMSVRRLGLHVTVLGRRHTRPAPG